MELNHLPEDSISYPVDMDLNSTIAAQTGGNVAAPMLHGNVIHGPVTLNFDPTHAAQSPHIYTTNNIIDQTKGSAHGSVPFEDQRAFRDRFKASLQEKFGKFYVGTSVEGDLVLLNSIFTEVYVVEGYRGGICSEHEVRKVEAFYPRTDEAPIQFSDIFKACTAQNVHGIKVLTVGIAGVGKTVSVHKFILDWAEGKSNQDIHLVFFIPFRELNMIRDEQYTLWELLLYFHSELSGVKEEEILSEKYRVVLIFDGLDESRISLDFDQKKLTNVKEKTTVDKLVTNLIKGDLLPPALIWITSRPAAANQIPRKCFEYITEIRGFTDQQKEEYFRKSISDQDRANKVISHIKSSRSLQLLCHIPVFCWIAAFVLLQIFTDDNDVKNSPTTLTEMYTRFLLFQTTRMNDKYSTKADVSPKYQKGSFGVKDVLKLAKFAFLQLEKEQIIFYESDLKECNIDTDQALIYSGLCTQIFRKDETIFTFVHLSLQEFLAALHVFFTVSPEYNPLLQTLTEKMKWRVRHRLSDLHKTAIDKALRSEKGHLDLFLRFLLGLSLMSNQRLLKSLHPQMRIREESLKDTLYYVERKINESRSSERCINLFHCLSELKDNSLVTEIQNFLRRGDFTSQSLSPVQWSALIFVLLMSEDTQEKFELKKYRRSNDGLKRLLPVVKNTRQALLDRSNLTTESYKELISILISEPSPLRELDLSNNDLQDSGVMLLSAGLGSSNCKLEILRICCCGLTKDGCEVLESILKSHSSLKDLDLGYNDILDAGVERLSVGLKSPHCKLESLRMCCCGLSEVGCEGLALVLSSETSGLKELDLSQNEVLDRGIKVLCTGLEKAQCKLEILRLSSCSLTKQSCHLLTSALTSNPSHLKELDLSYNHPEDSGVNLVSAKVEDPHCKLEKLNVDHGGGIRIAPVPIKYACELTLDPNTAHQRLVLSGGNRNIRRMHEDQHYPDHPERFDKCLQVLCTESVNDRRYWEVEWNASVSVAVTYKGIRRKGKNNDCMFGLNEKSWRLDCHDAAYFVTHNGDCVHVGANVSHSNRVGVYLDYPTGRLSFYSISSNEHTPRLLYTFNCIFTEPLYPGFGLYYDDASVSLCQIEQVALPSSCVSADLQA